MPFETFLSSPLAVKRVIAVTILLRCIKGCASVRICLGHNTYIYAWISKLFDIKWTMHFTRTEDFTGVTLFNNICNFICCSSAVTLYILNATQGVTLSQT